MESNQVANKTKLILLVDDEQAVVQALAKRCETLGVSVRKAQSAVAAMSIINQENEAPDLMLLDYHMPGADGLALCDMVRTQQALKDVPVILLTGHDNAELRKRCEQAGAHYVRKDVDAWKNLQPLIRRLLGLRPNGERSPVRHSPAPGDGAADAQTPPTPKLTKKILIIDDDPMIAKGLRVRLQALGYQAFDALTGMDGYLLAAKEMPDLIVLDYKMPEGWGNTILGKLKSNAATREIPVFILSGMTDLGIQRDILRLGAERWINKPFEIKDFIRILRERIGPP